ncbi:metallophosphoesterase, partial [bacterium]|nr:metallophosphoesterase [bacterium]
MLKRVTKILFVLFLILIPFTAQCANTWKWIAYGDTRTDDKNHRAVLRAIKTNTPDYKFIINVGDVVEDGAFEEQWETWKKACLDELGDLGQEHTPPKYMSAPGNHDYVDTRGTTNWARYLPGQYKQYGNQGKYFVFDYENARFIVLNSCEALTSPQYDMMIKAIENNPKDWLFMVWHYPIFDFGPIKYQDNLHDTWGIPLYKNGCDIIFTGHAHQYVRTHKLELNGDQHPPVDKKHGTVQIITGNGGASFYPVDENKNSNRYMLAYSFDEKQDAYFGYTELTIKGKRLTLKHIRTDGKVMDKVRYRANP